MLKIETKYGPITGKDFENYTGYFGIPYAKAPVGNLRFRRPEEPEKFDGVYAADHFRATSMQVRNHTKEFETDYSLSPACEEDCLFLNIWVPKGCEGKKLPVAFWIHGGGFTDGSGGECCFDGAAITAKEVILVTINYRLSIFGFLAHPFLSARDPEKRSGNYGSYDQALALKWVYENIEAFGGDSKNITIFGQSAGSMSVQTLISSSYCEGMIAKAIMESGFSYHGSRIGGQLTLEDAEKVGAEFVETMGIQPEELLTLPAQELFDKYVEFRGEMFKKGMRLPFSPIIDGGILPEKVDDASDNGRVLNIPIMMGSTEGDMGGRTREGVVLAREDHTMVQASVGFSGNAEAKGHIVPYVYYFKHHLPGEDDPGAPHSAELWYVFGTLKRNWRPFTAEDEALSEKVVTMWTNFMKNGDPNGAGLPEWRPCTEKDPFICDIE